MQTQLTCLLMFLLNSVVETCESYCTWVVDCGWALSLMYVQGSAGLLLKDIYLL